MANIFVNNFTDKLLKQNDTVKMLLLGETLRKISKSNTSDIFYNGELTKNIITEINENGMYFLILDKKIVNNILFGEKLLFPSQQVLLLDVENAEQFFNNVCIKRWKCDSRGFSSI